MSDKSGKADDLKVIQLEVSGETLLQIAELLPAIEAWSRAEGSEEPMSPADAITVAVAFLHATVFAKAHAMLAAGRVPARPTAPH